MKYLEFKDGNKMPIVGLGMWQATNEAELEAALDLALEAGYRHFDTAYMYLNEAAFGRVLKRWFETGKVKREDLFITTKLPPIGMSPDRVEQFLKLSLEALQLDYVDLYLIHVPFAFDFVSEKELRPMKDGKLLVNKTSSLELIWKGLEDQVKAGRAKSIGISNFGTSQVERIAKIATVPIANLQIELHAYFQQKALRETCKKHGITVVAYGSLGSPGRKELFGKMGLVIEIPPLLEDPVITEIAKTHSRTTSQILLKYVTQLGVAVIPKSTNSERLKNNISLFDFELTVDEMKAIEALDKEDGRSFNMGAWPGVDEHPEFLHCQS